MTSPNHWVNKKAKRTLSFDEVLHYQKVVVALKETMQLMVELDHPTSEAENSMTEIIFLVEDDPEGGYVARAIGESVFTQADSIQELRELVKDAVHCHYPDEATRPKLIRLHIVHDEIIAS